MKIGFTYDLKEEWPWREGDPEDANAEFDSAQTVDRIVSALASRHHTVVRIGGVHDLLKRLPDPEVDIIFNICEGRQGRNRESQVPLLCEMFDIPFVGADALTMGITLEKPVAKKCFMADGIPTPRFVCVDEGEDPVDLCRGLSFPLIVKTSREGTSKGITESSRVEDEKTLGHAVRAIHQRYRQPVLVEEFISGTEFTVAVLGNKNLRAMPVVQVSMDGSVDLKDKFYTRDRVSSDSLQYVCPALISADLTTELQDLAKKTYRSVGCRDFGRVDFRVSEGGDPYVLEINPLPSLDERDIFHLFPPLLGLTFEDVLDQIVCCGASRYGLCEEKLFLRTPVVPEQHRSSVTMAQK